MKISRRYPMNAARTDIDRAWLLEQLPRAAHPNALLEVALSPLSIVRIAAQTWVSVDTLIDYFLGDDDLTPFELNSLSSALDIFCGGNCSEYLNRPTLDICTDPEEITIVLHSMPDGFPLLRELLQRESVPQAVLYAAEMRIDLADDLSFDLGPDIKPRSKRITRRRRKAA